jgi:hypothetical protein
VNPSDFRRDRALGIDKLFHAAELLPIEAEPNGSELDDAAGDGRKAGRFQVEGHELDLREGLVDVIHAGLFRLFLNGRVSHVLVLVVKATRKQASLQHTGRVAAFQRFNPSRPDGRAIKDPDAARFLRPTFAFLPRPPL